MATLNELVVQVKKRLGLNRGSHAITCNASDPVDGDTITINGLILTVHTSAQASKWSVTLSTNTSTMATYLKTSIDNVMSSTQGITASRDTNVVTVAGARTVETSNASAFKVAPSDTEMEPPIYSDVFDWIKEGQLDVANKLSDQALIAEATDMIEEVTNIETSAGGVTLTPPTDLLRPVVFRYKTQIPMDEVNRAEKVPFDLLMDIRDNRHPFFKPSNNPQDGNKWYSIFNKLIQLSEKADTVSDAEMLYVKKPQTTAGTECDLPESLEKMVVDYACSKALNSIGKEEEAQIYLQQYLVDMQTFNAKYMGEEKDSHEVKESKARIQQMANQRGGGQ